MVETLPDSEKSLSDAGIIEIRSKIAGVTFDDRMQYVKLLKRGEQLFLKPEPTNQYDPNAVRVENKSGNHLGYLRGELAKELFPKISKDASEFTCFVKEMTGGEGKQSLGVNIIIIQKIGGLKK